MFNKNFIISLGKLLIAASWADGVMTKDEVNSLRDVIYTLPNILESDWQILESYTDSLIGPDEAKDILNEVVSYIQSDEDKEMVISSLKKMIEADGKITDEEQIMLEDVTLIVNRKRLGLFSQIGLLSELVSGNKDIRRKSGVNREERVKDFLENRIYFNFITQMQTDGVYLDIPEDDLRMMCLAAGLMTRVTWVDEDVSESERESIIDSLIENWEVDEEVAKVVTDISIDKITSGIEYSGMSTEFYKITTRDERLDFIKCLFVIANSSGKLHKGLEEIRAISRSLMLGRRDFLDAKIDFLD